MAKGLHSLGSGDPVGPSFVWSDLGQVGEGGDEVVMVQGREVELLERWWRCGGAVEV